MKPDSGILVHIVHCKEWLSFGNSLHTSEQPTRKNL